MKEIYSIEATNYQSTNRKINTVVLFFEDRVSANAARKALILQHYKTTRVYEHQVQGDKPQDTVEAVNNLIGA